MEELMTQGPCYLTRFNPWTMQILQWQNAFEYVIDFLQITNDRKVEFLLYMMEPAAITIMQKLFSFSELFNLTYEELISILGQTFGLSNGKVAAEHRFWSRLQMFGESVEQYVLALTKIINQCSSDVNTSNILKFRFIYGLTNKSIKFILLQNQNLPLNEAVVIAQELELYEIWSLMNSLL